MINRLNYAEFMQTVTFTIGMGSLEFPCKVRRYVLDWFRYLMHEQGITADDILSGKFILTLRRNNDESPYSYDELYAEITDWAKREFDIDLQLTVNCDPNAVFNQFDFIATVTSYNRELTLTI